MAVLGAPARCGGDDFRCRCWSHSSGTCRSRCCGCAAARWEADGVVALEREVPDAAALGARAARLLLLAALAVQRRQHAAQLCHRVGRRRSARPAPRRALGLLARPRLLLRRMRVVPNRLRLFVTHTKKHPREHCVNTHTPPSSLMWLLTQTPCVRSATLASSRLCGIRRLIRPAFPHNSRNRSRAND